MVLAELRCSAGCDNRVLINLSIMKTYTVTIELDTVEITVKAKNKSDARKKALQRLNRRKPSGMIRKAWRSNRREIDVEEGEPFYYY